MRITAIRETTVPIASSMRNASIAFDAMTASALAIVTDRIIDGERLVGYAFDSIGRYGKGGLLRERFMPRLLAAAPDALLDADGVIDPERCLPLLMANEKDGGHGERPGAVGLLDAALWDLRAKCLGRPLAHVLADRYGASAAGTIATYASCGHFRPGESLVGLEDEIRRALDAGYTMVKIKLGGANASDDAARVAAAARVLGDSRRLAVDVNGKLDMRTGRAWIDAMAGFDLAWIEEPVSPLDYARLAAFAEGCPLPIATGENLFSFDDALNLLRYGGLRSASDVIQIDPLLAYGVNEYLRILAKFAALGWSRAAFRPHAGHLYAAHLVAGLGLGGHEAAPDPALAYGGFWDGVPVIDGRVALPDAPGVGYERKANLFALLAPLGQT